MFLKLGSKQKLLLHTVVSVCYLVSFWGICELKVTAQESITIKNEAQVESNLITVDEIEFIGNTVFSDRELNQVLPPLSKKISLERLFYLRKLITDHYVQNGYVSSGAFIPSQELKNRRLKIQIVEGSLENIDIQGLKRLNVSYIKARLPETGKPLKIEELTAALSQLEQSPFFKTVQANLTRSSVGENLLSLSIEESNPFKSEFAVTNSYSPSIGSFGGVARGNYHLLGVGDLLSLEYNRTEGLKRISAGYSLPIDARGGTVAFNFTDADTEAIEDPVSALDIQADFEAYSVGIVTPVANFGNSQVTLGLEFESLRSETFIDGDFSFAFIEGLEDGKSQINALRFIQKFSNRTENSLLIASSQFNVGLNVLDTTINDTGIDGLFWSWQGKAQWLEDFSAFSTLTSVNLQLSDDRLLPLEQISLGGGNSVRGYRQNLTIGDNGIVGSFELKYPLISSSWGSIELIPFVDVGTVWNNSEEAIADNFLASIGLGIGYELSNSIRARLDYGIALVPLDSEFNSGSSGTQAINFLLSIQP